MNNLALHLAVNIAYDPENRKLYDDASAELTTLESAEARAETLAAQLEAVTKERDALKRSLGEALNSGNGVYRP